MTSHELAKALLQHNDAEVWLSVDVSTGDDDADARAHGDLEDAIFNRCSMRGDTNLVILTAIDEEQS